MERNVSRRQFVIGGAAVLGCGMIGLLSGCTASGSAAGASGGTQQANAAEGGEGAGPITMVWLPGSSATDFTSAREAFGDVITTACGREVELMTTTDYNVAIEALASGAAGMGYLGAEGYVQANKKNPNVHAGFVQSDKEGGLEGACYYSRICVPTEHADEYKDGDGYSIANIKGKSMSFVSATSTSGFAVPADLIVGEFGLESSDELLEAGAFFSDVIFGNSHPGSCVNLLAGDAEVAAFDDIGVDMYLDLVSGEPNTVGAVYKVKESSEAPFDGVRGKEFTIISISPVMNAPICFNYDIVSEEEAKKITEYFCSDTVANDERIFVDPEDENAVGFYKKSSDKVGFVEVTDEWFDPIRELNA